MKISGLAFGYNEKFLFQDLNLELKPSSFLLIRGPSGCGKSTLLKIIAELLPLQKGKIEFARPDIKIGYLHQDCHLVEHWSIQENLELVSADIELMQKLSKQFNLKNPLNTLVRNLSGGEKQRVSIIRLLLQKPDLALLDEPTAHLDDKNTAEIIQIIKSNLKDNIVIIVSHDHRIDSQVSQTFNWTSLVNDGV